MTKFVDSLGLKRLVQKIAKAVGDGTWLPVRKGSAQGAIEEGETNTANGDYSHAEGDEAEAYGFASHAEGSFTRVTGDYSHAQGYMNYNDESFIDMVGVGNGSINKNASVIYVKRGESEVPTPSDPKNGYQYLLGVGGYKGERVTEGMKSVQEVIADLEKRISELEKRVV